MTWTRLHDGFVEDPAFDGLTCEARWHYLCLVQYCSRTGRYDGRVTRDVTRRMSDVTSPETAVTALVERGLLVVEDDPLYIRVARIAEHVPPEYMRDEQRKPAQALRKQRQRQRQQATASESMSRDKSRVTSQVTPGQDGTGQGTPALEVEVKGLTPESETKADVGHLPEVPLVQLPSPRPPLTEAVSVSADAPAPRSAVSVTLERARELAVWDASRRSEVKPTCSLRSQGHHPPAL